MEKTRIITHEAQPGMWKLVAPCEYTGRDRTLDEGTLLEMIDRRAQLADG